MKQIDRVIKKLKGLEASFKANLILQVGNLPQNPDIKEIDSKCFTVQASDSIQCMSPQYHNWVWQHSFIIELIDKYPLAELNRVMTGLCTSTAHGAYWYRRNNINHRFHPEVIKNIKEIFEI